jgi:hypothetical protein
MAEFPGGSPFAAYALVRMGSLARLQNGLLEGACEGGPLRF